MAGSEVWFITGTSAPTGLGFEIGLAALAVGHRVIGTVRSKSKSAAGVKQFEDAGGKILEYDQSKDAASIRAIAPEAERVYGRIDVLVNNAAFSYLGAYEDFSEQEIRLQIDTNVVGPMVLTQALLPGMRSRKSGTIVNISSIAGQDALPAASLYAGSKFFLEGVSESLAREVNPLGIRVLIVEPGAFRTNFLSAFATPSKGRLSSAYEGGPADRVLQLFESSHGKQPGDPVKAAKTVVDVVSNSGGEACQVNGQNVLRLILGKDAVGRFQGKIDSLTRDLAATKAIAEATGF